MYLQIPYSIDNILYRANVLFDPYYSVDSVTIEFSPTATWIILLDFFEASHDWQGDIASIVTSDDVILVMRDYKQDNAETYVVFDPAIVKRMLNKVYDRIEADNIVISWRREQEVEWFLSTL